MLWRDNVKDRYRGWYISFANGRAGANDASAYTHPDCCNCQRRSAHKYEYDFRPAEDRTPLSEFYTVTHWQDCCEKRSKRYVSGKIGENSTCEQKSTWKIRPFAKSFIFLGCAQREAVVDHHAVQSKTNIFRRITTTVTDEKQNNNTNSSQQITAWSYDTKGHAERCEGYELAGKSLSALKPAETAWMLDNLRPKMSIVQENWHQFVLRSHCKSLHVTRIGRPDLL